MLQDVETICSDQQSLINAVGTLKCTRTVDMWNGQSSAPADVLGNTIVSDPGRSDLEMLCQITEQVDSAGGAATVQAQFVQADDEELTTNVEVLAESAAIAEATLAPSYRFKLGRKMPSGVTRKWVGFRYVIAGEAVTAGKVHANVAQGLPQLGHHA